MKPMEENKLYRKISVEDRLPETMRMYMCQVVLVEEGLTFRPVCYAQYDTIRKEWTNPHICNTPCEVTHWYEEYTPPTLLELEKFVNEQADEMYDQKAEALEHKAFCNCFEVLQPHLSQMLQKREARIISLVTRVSELENYFQEKMRKFVAETSPEELVKMFEKMGYKFVSDIPTASGKEKK